MHSPGGAVPGDYSQGKAVVCGWVAGNMGIFRHPTWGEHTAPLFEPGHDLLQTEYQEDKLKDHNCLELTVGGML